MTFSNIFSFPLSFFFFFFLFLFVDDLDSSGFTATLSIYITLIDGNNSRQFKRKSMKKRVGEWREEQRMVDVKKKNGFHKDTAWRMCQRGAVRGRWDP